MYVVEPVEKSEKAIIVLHDVFGPDSGRTKLISDSYADRGYHVMMPSLLRNEPWPEEPATGWGKIPQLFRMLRWLSHNKWKYIDHLLHEHVFPYARDTCGIKSIGLACFCWGKFLFFIILELI